MLMLHDGSSSCNCYTPSKVHSHSFGPWFFSDNLLCNNSTVFEISNTIIIQVRLHIYGCLLQVLMPYQSNVNCISHIQSIVDAIDLKNVSLHIDQVSADQPSTSVHTTYHK